MQEEKEETAGVSEAEQPDDLKGEEVGERETKIKEMVSQWNYKELMECQLEYPSFNALQFLKLFEVGGEFTFNRKTYPTFALFMKECLEHRDCVYGDWSPARPLDFLNPCTNFSKKRI